MNLLFWNLFINFKNDSTNLICISKSEIFFVGRHLHEIFQFWNFDFLSRKKKQLKNMIRFINGKINKYRINNGIIINLDK
jgi:hypothetical protein